MTATKDGFVEKQKRAAAARGGTCGAPAELPTHERDLLVTFRSRKVTDDRTRTSQRAESFEIKAERNPTSQRAKASPK